MKLKRKKQKRIKFKTLTFFLLLFFLYFPSDLFSEENFFCSTKKQSGLSNLGGEHKEIIKYLGLNTFNIKLSRSRKDIFKSEFKRLSVNKSYIPKNSHFIKLTLSKSNGEFEIFTCTWLFNIKKNEINQKSFNCLENENEAIFSFDSKKNFIYSSKFSDYGKLRVKSRVYHSLLGSCK